MNPIRTMHIHRQTRWQRPALLSLLALALCAPSAHAETLEGVLERGASHSVLWFTSPESDDLIGQVFANTSQAGQTILAHCLPGLACTVEGASTAQPDEPLLKELHFANQPSGWWRIEQVQNAFMQSSLPLSDRELRTRFGQLTITDEHWLLFNGSPVLASPPQATLPASAPTASAAPPTLLARLQTWWDALWAQLRHQLLALLGRSPADSADTAQAQPVPDAAPSTAHPADGTAAVVQGNNALDLVAHFALEDRDIVLLQDTGGTACPALYRFATLTPQGIAVTPEFGSCSGIAAVTLPDSQTGGTPEPLVTMTGFMGPFEPEAEQERASRRLHRFVLRQGKVLALEMQQASDSQR